MVAESLSTAAFLRRTFAQRDWAALVGYAGLLAIAVVWWQPHTLGTLGLVAAGVALWIPSEYVFHRWVLHLPLVRRRGFVRRVQRRMHHKHHEIPGDPRYLFIPWWVSPFLIALGAGLGHLVFGVHARLPCMLGYAIALCLYDATHFAAHVPYRPRTRWGAAMKRHHLLHHFKNERYWYGVTTPLADLVARTWPAPEAVDKSRTARNLAGDDPG